MSSANNVVSGNVWIELRARAQQQHQADLELIDLMARVAEVLSKRVQQPLPTVPKPPSDRPQFDRVVEALTCAGTWLSVNDISTTTNIAPAAVRGVLYGDRAEHFERHEETPRRIYWRLRAADIGNETSHKEEPEAVAT
jgi:hypothetical protein